MSGHRRKSAWRMEATRKIAEKRDERMKGKRRKINACTRHTEWPSETRSYRVEKKKKMAKAGCRRSRYERLRSHIVDFPSIGQRRAHSANSIDIENGPQTENWETENCFSILFVIRRCVCVHWVGFGWPVYPFSFIFQRWAAACTQSKL